MNDTSGSLIEKLERAKTPFNVSEHAGLHAAKQIVRQHTDWMTIDSAPRDGTSIIVCNPEFGQVNMAIANWDEDGWAYADGPVQYYVGASHWMPVPLPPKPE
jgi:hypothetical protein